LRRAAAQYQAGRSYEQEIKRRLLEFHRQHARQLVELHRRYVPIAGRRAKERDDENTARNYYGRMQRKQENPQGIIQDAGWNLSQDHRESLRRLLGLARLRPLVSYDELPDRLKCTMQPVRELLLTLHARSAQLRRLRE